MSKMFSGGRPPAAARAQAERLRSIPSHLRPPSPGLFGGKPFGFELHDPSEPELFVNKFPADEPVRATNIIPNSMLKALNGQFNYIVTSSGGLVVGKPGLAGGRGHIDLSGGRYVQAAGEVRIVGGEIIYIDNSSGHYLPVGLSAKLAAENAFRGLGFNVRDKYVEKSWFEDSTLARGGAWR